MPKKLVRTNSLNIRLSDREFLLITEAAHELGVSPTEFVRNAAKAKAEMIPQSPKAPSSEVA